MPTWIFDEIGWFASEYFIDFVDWEYCTRIRAAGYIVTRTREKQRYCMPQEIRHG